MERVPDELGNPGALLGAVPVSNAKQIIEAVGPTEYPHAIEATSYYIRRGDDQTQDFLGGLDLILDGIERTLAGGPPSSKRTDRGDHKRPTSRRG